MNDEIGYLANAAYFAGYSWNSILGEVPYYSYGYSLFLAPLYFLIPDANLVYAAALLLNGAFFAVSFIFLDRSLVILFKEDSICTTLLVLASVITPSALTLSQYAWAEGLLSLCAIVAFYILLQFLETKKSRYIVILSLLGLFSYIVHQRSLAMLISIWLMVIFLFATKKLTGRQLLLFFMAAAVGIVLQALVKNGLQSGLWNTGTVVSTNDYGGQIAKIIRIFTPEGLVEFLGGIVGKVYALILSYYMMPLYFVFYTVVRVIRRIKNKCSFRTIDIMMIFETLALAGAVGIATIFLLIPIRADQVVYTRYFDYLLSPLMMMSFQFIRKDVRFYRYSAVSLIVMAGITWGTQATYDHVKSTISDYFIGIQCPVMSLLNKMGGNCFAMMVAMTIVYLIIYFLLNNRHQWLSNLCMVFVVVLSVVVGYDAVSEFRQDGALSVSMREDIKTVSDNLLSSSQEIGTIYVLQSSSTYMEQYVGGVLQTQLPRNRVQYLNVEDVTEAGGVSGLVSLVPNDIILSLRSANRGSLLVNQFRCLSETDYFSIWGTNDSTLQIEDLRLSKTTLNLAKQKVAEGTQLLQKGTQNWEVVYTQGIDDPQVKERLSSEDTEYAILTNSGRERLRELQEMEEDKFAEAEELQDDSVGLKQEESKEEVESDEVQDGYVVFGPGLTLQPGTYCATITLECLNLDQCKDDDLGQFDVSINDGQDVLAAFPLTKELFRDGGAKTLALDFCSAAGGALYRTEFRLFTHSEVQFRVTDISYQYVGPQVKVLLPNTDDYNTVCSVVSLDSEFLPVHIIADLSTQDQIDYSDFHAAVSSQGHQVSLISPEELPTVQESFLMIPTGQAELIQSKLPDYTILARLQNYALLAPSSSDVCNKFRDNGGRVLSNGSAISLRYYAGAVSNAASSTQATLPEGQYRLDYEVQVAGASVFDSCGTLVISYSDQKNEIPLTKELFAYDVYRGSLSENVVLEENTKISAQVTTIPEVSGAQLDVWITPLS